MSTLGIRPGGGCHFLAEGYAVMARQLFPLVNKYNYGAQPEVSVTAPNIQSVSYSSAKKDEITLVFDQDVKWEDEVARRFDLDNGPADFISIGGTGKTITLKLAEPSPAKNLSYVRGAKWNQDQPIILGSNGIAALTFCEVPIRPARSHDD